MRTGIRTPRGRGRFSRSVDEAVVPVGPITFSELTSGESNVDASSYTTASVTLTSGKLYLISIYTTKGTPANPSAVATTGAGATFTLKAGSAAADPKSYSIWYCVPGSTITDTVVITASSANGCIWSIVEVTSAKVSGSPAGVDAFLTGQAVSAVATATTVTATLPSPIASGNARFTFGSVQVAETPTVSSGTWTSGTGRNHAGPAAGARVAWNGTPATTDTSAIWTSSGADVKRSVILEIALVGS